MTRIVKSLAAVAFGAAVLSACGQGETTDAAGLPTSAPSVTGSEQPMNSPPNGASGARASGSDHGSGTGTPAGLPTTGHEYGDRLLAAWSTGDRAAAGRYATPEAVTALFAQQPVKELVNYECTSEGPLVCGWIGTEDLRVELTIDRPRLTAGAERAVQGVKITP